MDWFFGLILLVCLGMMVFSIWLARAMYPHGRYKTNWGRTSVLIICLLAFVCSLIFGLISLYFFLNPFAPWSYLVVLALFGVFWLGRKRVYPKAEV